MTPRCLLVGHTAPVLCLSRASIVMDNNFLVSSSENGEMCTWDLVDGKCKENVKLPQVHTSIQVNMWCLQCIYVCEKCLPRARRWRHTELLTEPTNLSAQNVHFRRITCPTAMIFVYFATATMRRSWSWTHSAWRLSFRSVRK